MRLPTLVVALAAVALTGCTASTRAVAPADDLAEVRRQLNGRSAEVRLRDGRAFGVSSLQIDRDTTSWVEAWTHALVRIPTAEIAEVRQTDRPRAVRQGARTGALVGASAGGIVGVLAGYELSGICFSSTPCPDGGGRAVIAAGVGMAFAAVGAGVGALWGALGGAVAAPPVRWVFEPAPTVESASTPPPRPNPTP